MRKLILLFFITGSGIITHSQQDDCTSKSYPEPVLSESTRQTFESNLAQAEKKYENSKSNPDNIIWYGRRLAYLGKYREAVSIYSEGIKLFPENARFYRHRGHRYITLRCFDLAIADFEKGAELVRGQIDEMEEDGIPNAMNIPVSTLHTNIFYHLGLAYYLVGNNRDALLAFERCSDKSDNDDMMVAAVNWINIILREMGRTKDADERLEEINREMEIIENTDYLDILMMYKTGKTKDLSDKVGDMKELSNVTLAYGLGKYYLLKSQNKKAEEIFKKIVSGTQWSAFGYIAAEKELSLLK